MHSIYFFAIIFRKVSELKHFQVCEKSMHHSPFDTLIFSFFLPRYIDFCPNHTCVHRFFVSAALGASIFVPKKPWVHRFLFPGNPGYIDFSSTSVLFQEIRGASIFWSHHPRVHRFLVKIITGCIDFWFRSTLGASIFDDHAATIRPA